MTIHDLLTPESLAAFQAVKQTTNGNAPPLLIEFTQEQETHASHYPALMQWREAIENCDFAAASDLTLLASLAADGFLDTDTKPTELRPDSAVFRFKLIAPKIIDAFLTDSGMKVDYAYNLLHVCFRQADILSTVLIPDGWNETTLIDCEVFELPYGVAPDNFDDREKIHVYYLAGMQGKRFRAEPVYIGIGTGEAYGVGPTRRTTQGRFRFYRYDIKDNFQFEHIEDRIIREWTQQNVSTLPSGASIAEDTSQLLLARGAGDRSFMCLSDPQVADYYNQWIAHTPDNQIVFRLLELRKKHDSLPRRSCELPAPEGQLEVALVLAEKLHRYFFVAWQHPNRLTDTEGLKLYYHELPEFRRTQYQIYRIRPEYLDSSAPTNGLPIPDVLFDERHKAALESLAPGAVQKLDAWLRRQIVLDLYHFGNHPELRLCSALLLMRFMRGCGLWAEAIRATYDRRLNYLDFSVERLTQPSIPCPATAPAS